MCSRFYCGLRLTLQPRTQSYRRAVRCLSKECRPSPSWMITASEYTPFRPNQTRDYPRLRQIFPNLLLVKHQTTCTLGYESDWTLTWCGPDDRWHVQREDTIRLTMCVPTDAWFSCVLPLSPGPNEEAYGIDWHIHLYLRGTPYLHQAQGFIDYLQQCPATLSLVLYRFGAIRTQKEGWAWLDGLACAVAGRPAAGLPPLVTLRLLDPDWPLDSARLWSTLDLVGGHLRDLRLCLVHIRELTVAMETLAHFCPVLDIVRLDVLVDIIECEEAFDTSSGLVESGGTASQITISLRAPLRSTGSGLVWSTGRPAAFLHRAMARLAAPDCMAKVDSGRRGAVGRLTSSAPEANGVLSVGHALRAIADIHRNMRHARMLPVLSPEVCQSS